MERIETDSTKNLLLNQASIENIDGALYDYVNSLNLFCNTINGWTKIPIIWASSERSFQIKNNKELRDNNGSLIPPIISIERTNITKDPQKKGSFQSNLTPGRDRAYITKILNQDKTSNFANSDSLKSSGQINFVTSKKNNKIVYQHLAVRIPVYVTVEYKISILTNYLTQMNEALQPFISRNAQNYFVIQKQNYRYECFMDSNFNHESLNLGEEERKYKTVITVKTLGYLIGEGPNQERRDVLTVENPVEIKIPKENFLTEDLQGNKVLNTGQNAQGALDKISSTFKKTFLVGNGIDSEYNIIHNFASRDMYISVRTADTYELVYPGVAFQTLNAVNIDFGNIIGVNSHVVTIIS